MLTNIENVITDVQLVMYTKKVLGEDCDASSIMEDFGPHYEEITSLVDNEFLEDVKDKYPQAYKVFQQLFKDEGVTFVNVIRD